jgi:hypothetical protein
MEPRTIASGDPSACFPVGSLRSEAPRRSSSQSPSEKTIAPTRTTSETQPTVLVLSASSTSSNETDPISRPVPRAITTAITRRPGANKYETSAPRRSVDAASAAQKNASIIAP